MKDEKILKLINELKSVNNDWLMIKNPYMKEVAKLILKTELDYDFNQKMGLILYINGMIAKGGPIPIDVDIYDLKKELESKGIKYRPQYARSYICDSDLVKDALINYVKSGSIKQDTINRYASYYK